MTNTNNNFLDDDLSPVTQDVMDAAAYKSLMADMKEARAKTLEIQKIIANNGVSDLKDFIKNNKLDFAFEGDVDDDTCYITIYTDISQRFMIHTAIVKKSDFFR
jgi:hypothetical protein